MKYQYGKERWYNKNFPGRDDVVLWDVVEIEHEQIIKITFVSKNSDFRQGIRLGIDMGKGYIEIEGVRYIAETLWADTTPKEVVCRCISSAGLLRVFNVYSTKFVSIDSQSHSSGMLIEEQDGKRIYRCNDFGFETNFDRLVFTLEKL